MKVLSSKTIRQDKKYEPSVRFHKSGTITVNKSCSKLLGLVLKHEKVIFVLGDNNKYYIGKAVEGSEDGFILRNDQGRYKFTSSALLLKFITGMNLAIGPTKKASVRLDVGKECRLWEGHKLFEMY